MSEHLDVCHSCLTKKDRLSLQKKNCEMDADDLMMTALDAGAEDFCRGRGQLLRF